MAMQHCPVFETAHLLGKKWMIVLLQEVALHGDKGFNHIHKRMARVSPKIISQRLRELEKAGLIERKVIGGTLPERTSYSLTEKGKELYGISLAFRKWQSKYHPEIEGCEERECAKCTFY
jgi:DNA-binding HxlR family transcriptional regulator